MAKQTISSYYNLQQKRTPKLNFLRSKSFCLLKAKENKLKRVKGNKSCFQANISPFLATLSLDKYPTSLKKDNLPN